MQEVSFQRIAIQPVACLKQGKDLIAEQYWLFVGICTVGLLLGSLAPFGIVMGPMMCGIFLSFFERMRGETVCFKTLFRGFDYFMESLIATLIMMGAMMVLFVPLCLLMLVGILAAYAAGDRQGMVLIVVVVIVLFYAIILVFSLLAGTFLAFVYPLIVGRGLKAIPAIKTSFRAVAANLKGMVGLVLLNFLISMIAMIFCYLPAFLVAPVCIGAMAAAYRKVFPAAEERG